VEPKGSLSCAYNLPQVSVLSQIYSVHTLPFNLFKIPFGIILLYIPRSSKWSFSHHNLVCTSPRPYMCYIPYLSHRLGRNIIYLRTVFSRD